ncbi:hypothetical protein O9992_20920 [Vibrio lentus]|nr:hypothetical protein [Vibrio lentus]
MPDHPPSGTAANERTAIAALRASSNVETGAEQPIAATIKSNAIKRSSDGKKFVKISNAIDLICSPIVKLARVQVQFLAAQLFVHHLWVARPLI